MSCGSPEVPGCPNSHRAADYREIASEGQGSGSETQHRLSALVSRLVYEPQASPRRAKSMGGTPVRKRTG